MEGSSSSPPINAKRLEGKVALITGGASGIGAHHSKILLLDFGQRDQNNLPYGSNIFIRHGAKVVIADIQDNLGLSISDEISADYIHCDVTNENDVQNAVDSTVSKHGKLDIMFSNAGITDYNSDQSILAMKQEKYKKVFEVNLYGAISAAKHAARVMIPARSGIIIFTGSVASVSYGDLSYSYVASKHALVGLTKNLCVELGAYGIRVNCVSPYAVATPLLERGMGGITGKEAVEWVVAAAANLKGVNLETDDVAEAVVYLGSDESKYVSGPTLVIAGGYSLVNGAVKKHLNKLLLGSL